jgi:hypothetical protein
LKRLLLKNWGRFAFAPNGFCFRIANRQIFPLIVACCARESLSSTAFSGYQYPQTQNTGGYCNGIWKYRVDVGGISNGFANDLASTNSFLGRHGAG